MNRSPPPFAGSTILLIDPLELRRFGILSLLKPWTDASNVKIIQIHPDQTAQLADASSVQMLLFVVGAKTVRDARVQSWIASLRSQYPNDPLVLIAERDNPEDAVAAFELGARGYIPMSVAPLVAMEAVKFVVAGGSFFPPTSLVRRVTVPGQVDETFETPVVTEAARYGLTPRQQQVLERLRHGESNKLIAKRLKLRESTVKVHIRQIMRKLGAANRTQAALAGGDWPAPRASKGEPGTD
jgi:DNA-binding NarL/FixJ family response regulator